MSVDQALRLMAGVMVIVSLALGWWFDPNWNWFTVFIAVNLIQSAFTKWCPAMWLFKKIGLK